MRRGFIGAALLAAACGGGGSSTPTRPTEPPSLVAGKYVLQVTSSGGGCLATTFGNPPGPAPNPSISVDLEMAPLGAGWRGTLSDPSKGTLTVTGSLSSTQFSGALNGVASDGSKSVTFIATTHVMTGSSTGRVNELSGGFPAGTLVTFISPLSEVGMSMVTCPNTGWTLSPK